MSGKRKPPRRIWDQITPPPDNLGPEFDPFKGSNDIMSIKEWKKAVKQMPQHRLVREWLEDEEQRKKLTKKNRNTEAVTMDADDAAGFFDASETMPANLDSGDVMCRFVYLFCRLCVVSFLLTISNYDIDADSHGNRHYVRSTS